MRIHFLPLLFAFSFSVFTVSVAHAQWLPTGIPASDNVKCFAAIGGYLFAGTHPDGVFRSMDNGATWTKVNTGLPASPVFVNALITSGGKVFAAIESYGIYVTTDNGAHWTTSGSGVANTSVRCLTENGGNIFAGTFDGGAYLSTNGGATWNSASNGLPDLYVLALAVSGGNVFAGTSLGASLSTDNGTTWTDVDSGLPQSFVNAFAVIGNKVFAGTSDYGVFVTTNNGTSWDSVNTGLPKVGIYDFDTVGGNLLAGSNNGMFLSTDGGAHWTEVDTGLGDTSTGIVGINAIIQSGGYLLAGGSGSFRRPISEFDLTPVKEIQTTLPASLSLAQNYPNPFASSTTISFSLSASAPVILRVYNALGEAVATLVYDEMDAGQHNVTFHGENLQNGLYFYRLTAGKDSQNGLMTILH